MNSLKLTNVVKDGDKFVCKVTYEDIYNSHINELISCNVKFNKSLETKTSNGIHILPSVDRDKVKKIEQNILNNSEETLKMIFNIRKIEGKVSNFEYDGNNKKLTITPEHDFTANNTTLIDIVQGLDEYTGIVAAYEKAKRNDKVLNGFVNVEIYNLPEEECNQIIS